MRFGDTAVVIDPRGNQVEERFAAFAFSSYLRSGAATRINLEHDSTLTVASTAGDGRRLGKLVLRDLPDRLDLEARLPEGDVFSEVLSMLPPLGHDLAQTSIEFRSLMERDRTWPSPCSRGHAAGGGRRAARSISESC